MGDSMIFIEGLKTQNIDMVKSVPKADLHNHFCFGGNKEYIHKRTGRQIEPIAEPLGIMDDMHRWVGENVGNIFDGLDGRVLSIEACFQQAGDDNIAILDVGEDVWANDAIFRGDINAIVEAFNKSRDKFSPKTRLSLQIGLSRHCSVNWLLKWAEPFFELDCFSSIDLYGDELAQPIENFKPIYRRAKERGLTLKAHVGEWGTADDVMRAVEELELDEVQHGIAAAQSQRVMNFLSDNKIRLNICPTSNIKLGRVKELKEHPIRKLYDNGVVVTVNTDDVLVFGNSVSQEFMDLYQCGLFTAEELEIIRLNGISRV